jgi:Domain of unknown function (DUF4406)
MRGDVHPRLGAHVRIYLAGPISIGNMADHTRNAIHEADRLMAAGHSPFVPHLSVFWQIVSGQEYERWLTYDFEWIKVCEALIRMPGESKGADREVEWARELGIPVYFGVDSFLEAAHT